MGMLVERIEHKWVKAFVQAFAQCQVKPGDVVAVLCETQSRRVNVDLARLALEQLGAKVFELLLTTPALTAPAPVRSTGASDAIGGLSAVVSALSQVDLVIDCTVEGLLHAPELPTILQGSHGQRPRLFMVSNEHPEILERTLPTPELESVVKSAMKRLKATQLMRVQSQAGTDVRIAMESQGLRAVVGGVWGFANKPGMVSHWPAGLALAFPPPGSVNGTLVLAEGDVNLTFKTYLRDRVVLHIENDHVMHIEGQGLDAELMRSYWQSWEDAEGHRACYATSHVGFGLNRAARWDALAFYDKRDCNGTELRAFAGNFLYSTGANEVAKRFTQGHFDLPMRGCTVSLDGQAVVVQGQVQWTDLTA
jgi:2,5-dihydroxypyridine 5,6-dioxygenase